MAAVDPAEKPNKQQLGMQVIRKLLLHLPIVSTLHTFTYNINGTVIAKIVPVSAKVNAPSTPTTTPMAQVTNTKPPPVNTNNVKKNQHNVQNVASVTHNTHTTAGTQSNPMQMAPNPMKTTSTSTTEEWTQITRSRH